MVPLDAFRDRRIVVLGLGKSGVATARAAEAGGADVLAWDDNADRRAALGGIAMRDPAGLDWQAGDILSPAPGIPLTHPAPHPVIAAALAAGATVAGDIELFAKACPAAVMVGVTGTNGKSTTTALIAHLLNHCGVAATAAGNIGQAVLDLDPPAPGSVQVLELSSYQLDLTQAFRPKVGVFLNLTPDHLDRHGGMDGYMAAKARLFANMGEGDTAVVGIDDDWGRALADNLKERGLSVVRISVLGPLAKGIAVVDGQMTVDGEPIASLAGAATLPGRHNHQNAAAAVAACRALGCRTGDIVGGLASFPGLAHRIERIGEVRAVSFYNDSKATNADAASRALGAFENIYWIAGGKPKEGGLGPVLPFMGCVRRAYLIGEAMALFASELAGEVETRMSGTLATATEDAYADAKAAGGGVVLLSPACASFDQFPNFEARGNAFRAVAEHIIGREREGGGA
ncbi:MAG: UDP-N-acetylmuramoyl-L-alanine--D-glutamate ligase [Minwuia sp.]|uniref:UDP-N-acetylmuramoyl-L-alanine--D-glutamate ligase n=1 Tax=Minwuia sp. TaxID=2493630 RepID=UPI003A8627BC